MTATAHAVQPPAHAPAPPVQRKADPMADQQEAPQRLLTSLSAVPAVQRACASCDADDPAQSLQSAQPSVQRKCAACTAEDQEEKMPVQPQLEVGPVDDPYEREADDIAGRVMAMRDPGAASQAGSSVQRACAACSGKPEEVQRAPALPETLGDDDAEVPRMRTQPGGSGEHIAASATQLTSGGAQLSDQTRGFFETRMGRDLSDVRVHRGSDSDALNNSISSRAFTYQNHIWLSGAETDGPSFTMAHELAHVLQQTQPGAVRKSHGGTTADRSIIRRAPELKFSGNAYWTSEQLEKEKKNSGSQIHEDVLPQFQKKYTDLLMEVPMPKPKASGLGQASAGKADLYAGKDKNNNERTIGLNFRSKTSPAKMTSTVSQPHHSPPYVHNTSARPWLSGKSTIIGADEAPVDITLGELKPEKVKKGGRQLDKYQSDIIRTQKYTNEYLKKQESDTGTPQRPWPEPITHKRLNVAAPTLSGASGKSFGRHKLLVYQFSGFRSDDNFAIGNLVHKPPKDVYGTLKVKKHTDGVYYYWWQPEPGPTATALPTDLASKANLTDKMFRALRTNRKVSLLRRKTPLRRVSARNGTAQPLQPTLSRPAANDVAHRTARMIRPLVRRKSGNAKKFPNYFTNEFETAQWVPSREKVKAAYGKVAKSYKDDTGPAALTDWYLVEIDKGLESSDRQNIDAKFKAKGKPAERVSQLRKMHILSQRFAPKMATLRRLFGGVFAKGSELYEKIKSKFENRSKPTKSVSGGGILGALIRASFKVLLLIGRQIVASTMIQLTEQLKACMTEMFKSYFRIDEGVEQIEQRINGVKGDLEAQVEAFIGGDIETQAQTLFGPYGKKVDEVRGFIETMTNTAGPILTAYKVVRWGIQAVACASPPLVGCLWGLAARAIEWAAGKIMDTCWFMKEIAPHILRIGMIKDFMANTSVSLSNGIIQAGSKLFPAPVGPFLRESCKSDAPKIADPSPASICEEGGSGSGGMGNSPQPSPEAMAFWKRWDKLSFKKQMALKKMLGVKVAKGKAKADWDKMNDMLDWAESHDLAEMQRLADAAAKGDSSAIPGAVAKVKRAAEKSTAGSANSADAGTSTEPKSPDGDGEGDDNGGGGGNGGETEGVKRKHWLEEGTVKDGKTVNVTYSVRPVGSTVFEEKEYPANTPPVTVSVTGTDSDGIVFGPETIQVVPSRVKTENGILRITYTPVKNYKLVAEQGGKTYRLGFIKKERKSELSGLK